MSIRSRLEENATRFKLLSGVDPEGADAYLRDVILTSNIPAALCRTIFGLTTQKWVQLRHGTKIDGLEASDDSIEECRFFISKLATTLRECGDHGTVVTFSSYKTVQGIMKDYKKNLSATDKIRFRSLLQESFSDKMLFKCSTCTPNISAKKIRVVDPKSSISDMYVVINVHVTDCSDGEISCPCQISEEKWEPNRKDIIAEFDNIIGKLPRKTRSLCDHIEIVTFEPYDSKALLYKKYVDDVKSKKIKFYMDRKSFDSRIDHDFPNNEKICEKCNINKESKAKDARNKKRYLQKQSLSFEMSTNLYQTKNPK